MGGRTVSTTVYAGARTSMLGIPMNIMSATAQTAEAPAAAPRSISGLIVCLLVALVVY